MVFLHAGVMPAWLCAWLRNLEWEMEEDAAGAKSQPGREQLKRQRFPPWHREGAGAGSQESGREEAEFADKPPPSFKATWNKARGRKQRCRWNKCQARAELGSANGWEGARKPSHPSLRVQWYVMCCALTWQAAEHQTAVRLLPPRPVGWG